MPSPGSAFDVAGLDAAGRRVVAGEVAGVDVEAANDAGRGEPDDGVVMAGAALAAALPAIHPLAVVVVFVGDEDRRRVGEHAPDLGEEIVGGEQRLGAEAGRGEVDGVAGEGGDFGHIGHG